MESQRSVCKCCLINMERRSFSYSLSFSWAVPMYGKRHNRKFPTSSQQPQEIIGHTNFENLSISECHLTLDNCGHSVIRSGVTLTCESSRKEAQLVGGVRGAKGDEVSTGQRMPHGQHPTWLCRICHQN